MNGSLSAKVEKELEGYRAKIETNVDHIMEALDTEHKNLVRMEELKKLRGRPSRTTVAAWE